MATTLQGSVCTMLAMVVEIASAKWVVASHAGGAGAIRRVTLTAPTAGSRLAGLVEEIGKARQRFGAGPQTRLVVGYEAGQEGHWLVRALRARGIEAEQIDPSSLQVDRKAKRAKTDRLDAEALVRALWRWMTGEAKALRMVRVPSVADEDNREWQRERDRLSGERRGCEDRIVKKLRTQGVWLKGLGGSDRRRLREGSLCGVEGQVLEPMLQRMLLIELERLEAVEGLLRKLDAQRAQLAPAAAERARRLERLCGIGEVGSHKLALLLLWRDFSNRRQVGSCTGLVGMPYDSGVTRQDQGISKAGDPRVRALLIELAWLWLRYQPDSALTRWFRQRSQGHSKRGKRILIVAVARRLAIALWRWLKDSVVPEGARLKPMPSC